MLKDKEKSILYVNACVRRDSRTKRLAAQLLKKLGEPYEELCLENIAFPAVNEEYLKKRDRLLSAGDFQNDMFALAGQFAKAKTIVISAPYWDLSFPAILKQYLELVNVVGITFQYSAEGVPIGLCRAGRLFYVVTAGGKYVPEEFGFGYVKALAQTYYGIADVRKVEAVGLDMAGADADLILQAAENTLSDMKVH